MMFDRILFATTLSLLTAPAVAQELVAVKAGRVITMAGAEMKNAVVLIEDGRIKEVGAKVEVPWNATVIDASDKVVMPTYVLAHATSGMDGGSNERMANVPFLSVKDGIDPSSSFFEESLRNGIGTLNVIPGNSTLLGGVGMVVRPIGKTVEDMAVRDRSGLKLSLAASSGNKVAQIRQLRRTLRDAEDTRKDLERQEAEFEREKAAGATEKEKFEGKPDDSKKAIIEFLEGKIRGYLYVPSAAEVNEAMRMKRRWAGIDLALVAGPKTYKAARQLKALGLPVILDATAMQFYEVDSETTEETLVSTAKVLDDAGVPLIFSISTSTRSAQRYPWWQMATAIRNGVSRDTAMRALTIEPAKLLGLDKEVGTIEPGKIANLQILTGDPLKATSWVDTVLLEGEIAYERSTDARLQHLFGTDKN